MQFIKGGAASLVLAGMFAASSAQAQAFNFSTRGQFNSASPGCNNPVPLAVVVCAPFGAAPPSLGLSFTGVLPLPGDYAAPTTVTLGTFDPLGSGEATASGTQLRFRLYVDQIAPAPVGTDFFDGYITGYFRNNQAGSPGDPCGGAGMNCSQLVYTPINPAINIGGVQYTLNLNNQVAGDPTSPLVFKISAGLPSTIKADVTIAAVPEPSTYALMASGLVGVLGFARRRRQG